MMNTEKLLTTKQFASILNINKRTLMYYDDIGLFSPCLRKENNYRYYSLNQVSDLEMILTLRELNMSIEEIRAFLKEQNTQTTLAILATKSSEIDNEIKKLKEIKNLLNEKHHSLSLTNEVEMDKIYTVYQEEETYLLTDDITSCNEQEELNIILKHCEQYHTNRFYNHVFGSMIHSDQLYDHNFNNYKYYYTKTYDKKRSTAHIKPAGNYIVIYHKGDWSEHPSVYEQIIQYANSNNLVLTGYSYEEGMNDLSIQNTNEYVTKFCIAYKKKTRN